jgi:hypothetical protein
VGVRTRPWERTQVESSINTQATEYGPRTFANFGLTQGFQWREHWAFDVGIDQSNTIRGSELEPLNPNAPLASGTLTDDFFAAFLGASYRHELWQLTSRLEHRNSNTEDRWSSTTGWYREPIEGQAMSVSLQGFTTDGALGKTSDAVGRFAWAFRPDTSRWIVFDRLELKYSDQSGLAQAFDSSRVVNNLHANWQLNPSLQLGLHGAALHSWESNIIDYSSGIDVGTTLAKNVWISVGYNFDGFKDDDFSASRHTAQGPYLTIRIKADQDTIKDLNLDSLHAPR